MYYIESLIDGRWVRLFSKKYTYERAASIVAYMCEETGKEDARYVPAS